MDELCRKINYTFKNKNLLIQALTHPSMRIKDINMIDNQRLEFLGDAVLELVVSRFLFEEHPDRDEGWLTNMRVNMVCRDTLVELANSIELGKHLIMSASMDSMGGRKNAHNLEDAFEALVGAIYIDSNISNVIRVVFPLYKHLSNEFIVSSNNNCKGMLQELLQANHMDLPLYKLVNFSGPAHDRIFEMALYINNKEICRAKAKSKKAAEQLVAQKAMHLIKEGTINEA